MTKYLALRLFIIELLTIEKMENNGNVSKEKINSICYGIIIIKI